MKSNLYLKCGTEYRIVVQAMPSWDCFGEIVSFLKEFYKCRIVNKYDGPDARRWILEIYNIILEVIHDDVFGNYILPINEEGIILAEVIGRDLESRFKS